VAEPEPAEASETPGERLAARVRELRRERHWSLERLSRACGVSRSMLSSIERREANPTLGVTSAIAQAFGLSIGELVDEPGATPPMHVVRHDDATQVLQDSHGIRVRALTPVRFEEDLELYEVRLQIDAALRSEPHFPGTREVVTVTSGQVEVSIGGERVTLDVGDSVSYRADIPHAIVNTATEASIVILVDAYD
jgi:transcriptional regulator with XRE-family HTH domain